MGGMERLVHAVGEAKAMDIILTGRVMDVREAERAGLVARIVPPVSLIDEAVKVGEIVASMSLPSALAAKAAVNRAFESLLAGGIRFERIFYSLFVTTDQKEGTAAFIAKAAAEVPRQISGGISTNRARSNVWAIAGSMLSRATITGAATRWPY